MGGAHWQAGLESEVSADLRLDVLGNDSGLSNLETAEQVRV